MYVRKDGETTEKVFLYFIGRLWRFFSDDFRDEEGCYQTRIGHWSFLILPLIALVSKIAGLPQLIELLRGVKRPIQGLSLGEGEGFRKRNPVCETQSDPKGRSAVVDAFVSCGCSLGCFFLNGRRSFQEWFKSRHVSCDISEFVRRFKNYTDSRKNKLTVLFPILLTYF